MFKLLGAALIVTGASSVGIRMALRVRQEEQLLRSIVRVLELWRCEIGSSLTPTVQLCELAAGICKGMLKDVFTAAAQRMALQEDADAASVMEAVLLRFGSRLPLSCICRLRELGSILGAYDAQQQTQALEALIARVNGSVDELRSGAAERCRSYEVMGVCAGCALAIILL